MKSIVWFAFVLFFAACNNSGNESTGTAADDPAEVQPPAEAIPDSLSIVNDSAIMADTSNTNKDSRDTVRGNP